jgi:hypothetical protein
MALWKLFFDNDLMQRLDIQDLEDRAHRQQMRALSSNNRTRERFDELEQQVGELTLLCRALVSVLTARGALDAEALRTALTSLDGEDGVLDGRVTPESERPLPAKPAATPYPTPVPRTTRRT